MISPARRSCLLNAIDSPLHNNNTIDRYNEEYTEVFARFQDPQYSLRLTVSFLKPSSLSLTRSIKMQR